MCANLYPEGGNALCATFTHTTGQIVCMDLVPSLKGVQGYWYSLSFISDQCTQVNTHTHIHKIYMDMHGMCARTQRYTHTFLVCIHTDTQDP